MFLEQPNLFISQEPCKALHAKIGRSQFRTRTVSQIQQWLQRKGRKPEFEVFTGRLIVASLVEGQNLRGEPYVEVFNEGDSFTLQSRPEGV